MKRLLFLILFLFSNLFSDESDLMNINNSFITKYEYGEMLYNNPRGIGCNTCHGDKAEGKEIVSFTHIHNKKKYNCVLVVPNIKNVKYEEFFEKVNSKKNPKRHFEKEQVCEKLIYRASIMPTYFLVDEEINAIYYYVKNLK